MILVSEARESDRTAWNDFVTQRTTAQAYHSYEWRDVFERAYRHKCYYLIARNSDSGDVCGILPLVHLKSLLFGNFLVSVPCFSYAGVLADSTTSRTQLIDAASSLAGRLGASHVELRHDAGTALDLPYRDDKVAMRMPIPEAADTLWAGFSSKLRAQIRRPRKEGATCENGGVELLDEFYSIFSRNMRDLGTPVFPKALFREICSIFPDQTRFFIVRLNEQPCAAGITYGFRDRLEVPSASSLREFNKISVNMLLYWSMIEYAAEADYKIFDFGRTTKNSGTYRFKAQWGAEPEALHWHYCLRGLTEPPRLNPDNPRFRLAVGIWRHLPLAVANAVGPRIVKHLP